MLKIEIKNNVHILYVELADLDAAGAASLRETVRAALPTYRKFVIDLSKTNLIDSGGLGGLVVLLKATSSANAELALCGLRKPVRVMFELTRMHRIFEIYNDVEECLKVLG